MRQAALKFGANAASQNVSKKRVGNRSSSRGKAEHTTTVRTTSKNIYKPCFNMPAKEPKQQPIKKEEKKANNPRAAAKAYAEA